MKKIVLILGLLIAFHFSHGQRSDFVANYDESKVPDFEVPDPLKTFDGRQIKSTRQWEKIARPELLEFFAENVYGKVPGVLGISSWKIVEQSDNALDGKARRKQVELGFQQKRAYPYL
jgi:hypothetical protein